MGNSLPIQHQDQSQQNFNPPFFYQSSLSLYIWFDLTTHFEHRLTKNYPPRLKSTVPYDIFKRNRQKINQLFEWPWGWPLGDLLTWNRKSFCCIMRRGKRCHVTRSKQILAVAPKHTFAHLICILWVFINITSALTLSEGLVNGMASLTQQSIKVYELDRKVNMGWLPFTNPASQGHIFGCYDHMVVSTVTEVHGNSFLLDHCPSF